MRVKIPVTEIEFEEGGDTIWIQGPGYTALRMKVLSVRTKKCVDSPKTHCDVVLPNDIFVFCLGEDATVEE